MRVPARRKGSHCDADIPGRRPGNVPANCTATIVLKCAVASEKSNHVRTHRALNVRRNYSFQGAMQVYVCVCVSVCVCVCGVCVCVLSEVRARSYPLSHARALSSRLQKRNMSYSIITMGVARVCRGPCYAGTRQLDATFPLKPSSGETTSTNIKNYFPEQFSLYCFLLGARIIVFLGSGFP